MKKLARKTFQVLCVLAVLICAAYLIVQWKVQSKASQRIQAPSFSMLEAMSKADLALGQRIVHVRSACVDCHGQDLAGKLVVDDPAMGTYYSANLTPSGLAAWSDDQIAAAIRYGVHRTNRSLMFMPSFDYVAMSQEDIASIIVYLRSLPAVEKSVQKSVPGPMANVLHTLGKMPILLPATSMDLSQGFAKKPDEGATLEFGRYLVQTSCIGCHGQELQGGTIAGGPPSWPEASDLRFAGVSKWTEASFIRTLKTGVSARTGLALRPPMPMQYVRELNDMEMQAMWLYLSSLQKH
ncbi:MAG TPA: c-type cytochrome [Oligoflexus sp.]|uniref:c-type cytochrome n=1 Tax=Oligoflexus sp. TaxID=1971216 RepID=UPI002D4AA34A|nr:c-type cytochrome [Oligoflexus sp.]HYX38107.1 c-type cytochrome [Oligoflexus sp.]